MKSEAPQGNNRLVPQAKQSDAFVRVQARQSDKAYESARMAARKRDDMSLGAYQVAL